ncbi:MAG: hypothetical protein ACPGO5_02950 [Patescibacteria group bacterium]
MDDKPKKSRADQAGGMVFVGFIMLGLGFGFYYGSLPVGLFLGLGTGFILFGLIKAFMKG